MTKRLVITAGPDNGRAFPIEGGQTLVIGRSKATDTQLTDPRVSRVHCRLVTDGESVSLIDEGSSSGTLVNGTATKECQLRPGDVVSIGDTQLKLVDADTDRDTTILGGAAEPKGAALPSASLVGHTVSHYDIERLIAKGKTGTVYLARDRKHNRRTAIKIIPIEYLGNEKQRDRFIRAVTTMLKIKHPNIVKLYGAGISGRNAFVAMQFVDGESLTQVIERIGTAGMLPWKTAFRVAVHVARALQCAHEHNIIHRNVLPTNILQRGEDKVCLLGDLTLAKALEGTNAQAITDVGEIVGELQYMAPERIRDGLRADIRSDIYGLGATVYALLTGHPPFRARAVPELVKQICEQPVEDPKKYQLAIPDGFRDLVVQMLEKDVARRPQDPTQLLVELERVVRFLGQPDEDLFA